MGDKAVAALLCGIQESLRGSTTSKTVGGASGVFTVAAARVA